MLTIAEEECYKGIIARSRNKSDYGKRHDCYFLYPSSEAKDRLDRLQANKNE
jgi:hypothetical protein